jgi:hypothetical protein
MTVVGVDDVLVAARCLDGSVLRRRPRFSSADDPGWARRS